jgi:uncharacterized protein (TIGR03437 family)
MLQRRRRCYLAILILLTACAAICPAAPDRITRPVDPNVNHALTGHVHPLAQSQFDRGAVDPALRMDHILLMIKPSTAQQAELERLLVDQQNPSSPRFHRWLTPEDFGARFGLGSGDRSKIVAWLVSAGFTVLETGRGRNWIAFSGTALQVGNALRTSIHRFDVQGKMHIANVSAPFVPEALADVVDGFVGLHDFHPRSYARIAPPDYNSGSSHYLAPEDFAVIYHLAPLYGAGIDGSGQSIAVVGQSDVLLSDIQAFRARYNLPANDPKMIPYSIIDPGFTGDQIEGNLDLEWSGAVAPNATIYYVYGQDAFAALIAAVDFDLAPIISISYGSCEIQWPHSHWRSIAQQANAQGITILAASGDSGAAGCDFQGFAPFASEGLMANMPGVLPEVTAVGGTQFVEGAGTYWASSNSPNLGSALSYIPEAAWNESSASMGLASTGGGVSVFFSKPAWQTGPGVPPGNARYVPDISLSAACHDGYDIYFFGLNGSVCGTSASAPSMAGIVALINQYQTAHGFQAQAGLGNINPQLYRLAQSAPSAFHDTVSGSNIVPCEQGSPDCLTGSFGYAAAAGFDPATGLGSIDANNLVTLWNTRTQASAVNLVVHSATVTMNDTIGITATVSPASGAGTPTGTVDFSASGVFLGSVPLTARNGLLEADLSFPAYLLGNNAAFGGALTLAAQYSGDAAFSGAGATTSLKIVTATDSAAIVPIAPETVWSTPADAQGLSWETPLQLLEVNGVAARVTGFAIDGQAQSLPQYFPSQEIPPNGVLSATIILRNLTTPAARAFSFTGIDALGHAWSRQISVKYLGTVPQFSTNFTATPLVVAQNLSADPSCQWPVQLNIDEAGGFENEVGALALGGVNLTYQQFLASFGTIRMNAWGGLVGTVCFSGITPPAADVITLQAFDGPHQVTVSFTGPPSNSAALSASPAAVTLAATGAAAASATLSVNLSDKTQPWSASVFPANRTTSWLSLSPHSGTGPGQITLSAAGAGFEPGAYHAVIVIQSLNSVPQFIDVPVMFVFGGSGSGTAITSVTNAASFQPAASPGMLLSVFGTNLSNTVETATTSPLPFSISGVSATINGTAAPLLYVSSAQINLQVPYEVGSGPAVLSIDNNGQIAGFAFNIAPSAPGVFADSNGNLVPAATASQGGVIALYATGIGELQNSLIASGQTPASDTPLFELPMAALPLSVSVGGAPAFIQYAAISPGLVGTLQVNFTVPGSIPPGKQPVVITVGGVSSPPVYITVQPSQ